MKFLIIRLGSLGDVIHGIPTAAALRRRYPDARIDWIVDPLYVEVLNLVECLDQRIPFDPRDLMRGKATAAKLLGELRRERYDAALDLQGLIKSAVLARLAHARMTIGFPRKHLRESAARLFYTKAPDPGSAAHVIDKNLALLAPLDVTDRARRFPIVIPRTPVVQGVVDRLGSAPFAILNPGAAWPNKRWPPDRFGHVAAAMHRDLGMRSIVLWGPGEEKLASAVAAASQGAAEPAPRTTITDIFGLARSAKLVVSGDTGPLHIAGAVGTPLVALFGPTYAERNGPWSPADITISQNWQCICHYERQCRRSNRCIDDIGVDAVMDAIRRRLAEPAGTL